MYFHAKVQKKLFALAFMHKIFYLSFPEQYTVHWASTLKKIVLPLQETNAGCMSVSRFV